MRAVGSPLPGAQRCVGEDQGVPSKSRQHAHLFENSPPLARWQLVVAKHDPRSRRQSRDRGSQIAEPRVGHKPDFGKRVVARGHWAAYSAAMNDAETRLADVRAAIAKAAAVVERSAETVDLIAVSKTQSADAIRPLMAAGQRDFGENRVQEAEAKWPELRSETADVRLHLVGQLQSNKAQDAVALFDVIHSVDRTSLITALGVAEQKLGKRRTYFLQVNIGGETQKGGCAIADIASMLARSCDIGLGVVGLMAVPPAGLEPAPYFALLAKLARDNGLHQLSMGMSGDFETAVKLGATHVRVGTALFGVRL